MPVSEDFCINYFLFLLLSSSSQHTYVVHHYSDCFYALHERFKITCKRHRLFVWKISKFGSLAQIGQKGLRIWISRLMSLYESVKEKYSVLLIASHQCLCWHSEFLCLTVGVIQTNGVFFPLYIKKSSSAFQKHCNLYKMLHQQAVYSSA